MASQNLVLISLLLGADSRAGEKWNLETLMDILASQKHPPVHYRETRESAFLQFPQFSQGVLSLLPDGTLIKEKRMPFFERLSVSHQQVSFESTATGTRTFSLAELPGVYAFTDGLRALFNGSTEVLLDRFTTKMSGNRSAWRLTLKPRDKHLAIGVEEILVSGNVGVIQQLRITETDDDSTLIEFEANEE